jgi:predicted MFS family arabinose efflux permease
MSTSATRGVGSTLAILFLVNLLAAVDRTALAAVLPAIKRDLVLSDTQLGFLTGIAFSAFYAVFGLPLASWADRRNRRNVLCFSVLFWSLATAATGMVRSFSQLAGARMLVAVGEAGGVPAAHSLLSELTPVTRRPMVFAIHSAAAPLGALVGLAGVGILADLYGWRTSFFVLGLVGIPVFALIALWLPEPRQTSALPTGSEKTSWHGLLSNRAFLWLLTGFAFGSFAMAGLLQWLPSYFGRTFGLSLSEAGVLFGLAYGSGAVAGMLLGGICANRLMRRGTVWALWIASLSYVLGAPLLVAALAVDSLTLSLTLVALGTGIASAAYGPAFAMIQTIAEPQMRAKASAISLLVSNLVGAGLGPLFVGVLSDRIGGEDSLRMALLWLSPALFLPAICYWRSATAFNSATSTNTESGR